MVWCSPTGSVVQLEVPQPVAPGNVTIEVEAVSQYNRSTPYKISSMLNLDNLNKLEYRNMALVFVYVWNMSHVNECLVLLSYYKCLTMT